VTAATGARGGLSNGATREYTCSPRVRLANLTSSTGHTPWFRSAGALKRSLPNWSGAFMPRPSGRVIGGICIPVGCAGCSVIPSLFSVSVRWLAAASLCRFGHQLKLAHRVSYPVTKFFQLVHVLSPLTVRWLEAKSPRFGELYQQTRIFCLVGRAKSFQLSGVNGYPVTASGNISIVLSITMSGICQPF
jgi:hypothetical protein